MGICVWFGTDPLPLRVMPSTTGTFVIQIGTFSSSSDRKTAMEEAESINWPPDISPKAEGIKMRK